MIDLASNFVSNCMIELVFKLTSDSYGHCILRINIIFILRGKKTAIFVHSVNDAVGNLFGTG
jgi:hypothetical protein